MTRRKLAWFAMSTLALTVPAFSQEIAPVGRITPVGKLEPVGRIEPVGKLSSVTETNSPEVTADSIPFLNKLPQNWWDRIPLSTDKEVADIPSARSSVQRPDADGPYAVFTMKDPRSDEDWTTEPRVFETREQAERFARNYQAKNGVDSLAYPQKIDTQRWDNDRTTWIDERKQILNDVKERWLKPETPQDRFLNEDRTELDLKREQIRNLKPTPTDPETQKFIDRLREKYKLTDPVQNQIEGAIRDAESRVASIKEAEERARALQIEQLIAQYRQIQAQAAARIATSSGYAPRSYQPRSGSSSSSVSRSMARVNAIGNFAARGSGYRTNTPPAYSAPSIPFPSYRGASGGGGSGTLVFDDNAP